MTGLATGPVNSAASHPRPEGDQNNGTHDRLVCHATKCWNCPLVSPQESVHVLWFDIVAGFGQRVLMTAPSFPARGPAV
jgi:hypothetical protein